MGFWSKLFGKKDEGNNCWCPQCEALHFVPGIDPGDATIHDPVIIDGASYAIEYCCQTCEDAAKLKSTETVVEIEEEDELDGGEKSQTN